MFPRTEPASDITAPRHSREVIKMFQNAQIGQALERAQRESGAADSATGNTKCAPGSIIAAEDFLLFSLNLFEIEWRVVTIRLRSRGSRWRQWILGRHAANYVSLK